MSENTENVKMQFAQRIRDGGCVICGDKQPVEDLNIQNILMPTKEQKGASFITKNVFLRLALILHNLWLIVKLSMTSTIC